MLFSIKNKSIGKKDKLKNISTKNNIKINNKNKEDNPIKIISQNSNNNSISLFSLFIDNNSNNSIIISIILFLS